MCVKKKTKYLCLRKKQTFSQYEVYTDTIWFKCETT